MAKLYCSEMAGRVADRAVQVFGGRGYMRENVAERFFRELRVERIWEGTSEIQRTIIAGQMAKRGPAPSPNPPNPISGSVSCPIKGREPNCPQLSTARPWRGACGQPLPVQILAPGAETEPFGLAD